MAAMTSREYQEWTFSATWRPFGNLLFQIAMMRCLGGKNILFNAILFTGRTLTVLIFLYLHLHLHCTCYLHY